MILSQAYFFSLSLISLSITISIKVSNTLFYRFTSSPIDPFSSNIDPARILVTSNGSIFYELPLMVDTYCHVNVAKVPFDTQTCEFQFMTQNIPSDLLCIKVRDSTFSLRCCNEKIRWYIPLKYYQVFLALWIAITIKVYSKIALICENEPRYWPGYGFLFTV